MSDNGFSDWIGGIVQQRNEAKRQIGTLEEGVVYSRELIDRAYGSSELIMVDGRRRWRYNTSKHCPGNPLDFLEVGDNNLEYVGEIESPSNTYHRQS